LVDVSSIANASKFVNVCHAGRVTSAAPHPAVELPSCCPATAAGGLDAGAAQRLAAVLKALADPTRLRLVSMVAAHPGGEACVCELTDPVGLRQPTVSHHLRILVAAGVLRREQRGRWAFYRLVPGTLDAVAAAISPARR
jgi:ArsR family transcriptional regulator, arsenate/arsenite/antimonite-responsive transcriptional repressor